MPETAATADTRTPSGRLALAASSEKIALGPLDGRYQSAVAPLVDYLSEAALNRDRVAVEVEWLIHLTSNNVLPGAGPDGSKLLALQIGFMGGSRYMLLRGRTPNFHDRLEVLEGDCDGAGALAWLGKGYRERRSPTRGYFRTDYCAVRSAQGLANLALEAPAPKRIMEFVGPAPRKDVGTELQSEE